jgi:hypothetical protein
MNDVQREEKIVELLGELAAASATLRNSNEKDEATGAARKVSDLCEQILKLRTFPE